MGRDVPAIIVSQYDRRRYRDKVRRCLDVFARMLQDARFKEAPQQVGLEAEFYLVDGAGDAYERGRGGARRDRRRGLGTRAGEVQPGGQPGPPPAGGRGAGRAGTRPGRQRRVRGRAGAERRRQAGHDRHPADPARAAHHRGGDVAQPPVLPAQRADVRGARRGDADRHRGARAPAHPRRQHHAGGRLHQRPAAPAGHPGGVRQLLERRPGGGRDPGGGRRQLAVPVRQGTVAREPDPTVPAGHRHQAGGTPDPGGAATGLVR